MKINYKIKENLFIPGIKYKVDTKHKDFYRYAVDWNLQYFNAGGYKLEYVKDARYKAEDCAYLMVKSNGTNWNIPKQLLIRIK